MPCSVNDLFMNAYVDNNFEDPHQVFANDLGIPRHEAKKIVYQILYSSQFLKSWAKNMCEGKENDNGNP